MPATYYPDNGVLIGGDTIRTRRTTDADTDEVVLGADARLPGGDFEEYARAEVEAMLAAGAGITLTPSGSGASRILTIINSGTIGAHAASHQNGGGDEIATATAAANAIPKAAATGKLSINWFPLGTSSTTVAQGSDSRFGLVYRFPMLFVTSTGGNTNVSGVTSSQNVIVVLGTNTQTITLVGFASVNSGTLIKVINLSTGDVAVTTDGATVDGAASLVIPGGGRRAVEFTALRSAHTGVTNNWSVSNAAREKHASSHVSGASDSIKLDDLSVPDDTTDLDATASVHGLMPKADKAKLDGIWVSVPASAAATGTAGQAAYDADYLYVCTATDTWARYAKAAW